MALSRANVAGVRRRMHTHRPYLKHSLQVCRDGHLFVELWRLRQTSTLPKVICGKDISSTF